MDRMPLAGFIYPPSDGVDGRKELAVLCVWLVRDGDDGHDLA